MNMQALILKVREAIPDLLALYQFGSQGTDTVHRKSDLDLAFLSSGTFPSLSRYDLAQDLAALAFKSVDLVDLRQATTVMKMQVVSTGICIFSDKNTQREYFEMFVYSSYARFNEERRGILKDIQKRGSIYA